MAITEIAATDGMAEARAERTTTVRIDFPNGQCRFVTAKDGHRTVVRTRNKGVRLFVGTEAELTADMKSRGLVDAKVEPPKPPAELIAKIPVADPRTLPEA